MVDGIKLKPLLIFKFLWPQMEVPSVILVEVSRITGGHNEHTLGGLIMRLCNSASKSNPTINEFPILRHTWDPWFLLLRYVSSCKLRAWLGGNY